MHGWIPVTAQVLAAVTSPGSRLACRRWRLLAVPAAGCPDWRWLSSSTGASPATASPAGRPGRCGCGLRSPVCGCRGSAGLALGALVATRHRGGGRAVTSCAVRWADAQLLGGLLPHRADRLGSSSPVVRYRDRPTVPPSRKCSPHRTCRRRGRSRTGQAIPATISKFKHRGELVYLPPSYFASNPPPAFLW